MRSRTSFRFVLIVGLFALLVTATLVASEKAGVFVSAQSGNGRYDTDGDSLIEITNLEQLDAIRHDGDGDGVPWDNLEAETAYAAAFPTTGNESVCISCNGYELTRPLDFDDPASYTSGQVNTEWTTGLGWLPINSLGSTLAGNGHTVSNLYINRPGNDPVAFISYASGENIVRDLGLINIDVSGGGHSVAGLVQFNTGIIRSSYVTGRVTSVDGGTGTTDTGGLVATNSGTVMGSHSTANVSSAGLATGGLVGNNRTTGKLIATYATGSVRGIVAGHLVIVGGLVGVNSGNITASFAAGGVSVVDDSNRSNQIAGLAASNNGTITTSYWDTQASGQTKGVDRGESSGAEGKTTAQLQSPTRYTGIYATWDETEAGDVWDFGSSTDYPTLKAATETTTTDPSPDDCLEDLGTLSDSFTRTGTWTTDCPSTSKPNAYARFYSFILDQESSVDIELIQTNPRQSGDTRSLGLLRGAGREGNPVIVTPIGCCPNITRSPLAAGTYTVEAINETVGPNKGFILEITLLESTGTPVAGDCLEDLGTLTSDASRTGNWTSDCASATKTGNYARFYSFTLAEDREVTIDLTSGEDTVLNLLRGAGTGGTVVANNDDGGSGTNSRIIRTLQSGTYTIEATTFGAGVTGSFNISISLSEGTTDPDPTPTEDCAEDLGTLTADVSRTGNWTSDCASVTKAGNYARFYSFSVSLEQEVTIDLTSSVDTVLNLLRGAGTGGMVVANNDDGGSGTNSRIIQTLQSGTYTIEATTFSAGVTGSFNISISLSEGTTDPDPTPTEDCAEDLGTLTASVSRTETWASDCPSTNEPNTYARFYQFVLGQETDVTIDLSSSRDTVLYLRGPVPGGVIFNDDVEPGSNTDSQISQILPAGDYTVEASTYSAGQTGSFTLTINLAGDTTIPPAGDCVVDLGTASGQVDAGGIWQSGCESETRAGRYAQFYTFTLSQQSQVAITLGTAPGGPDTYLYLRRGQAQSGAHIAENDDHQGSQVTSQIEETLSAGTYTVEATTYSAGQAGLFTLTIAVSTDDTVGEDNCVETVTDGRPVSGEWAAGCESSVSGRGYARFYAFTLERFTDVTITLTRVSGNADTFLYLRRGTEQSGPALRENDDHEGSTAVSEIPARLARGTYTIEATTYSPGQTGSFTLSIAGLDGPQPGDGECLEDLEGPIVGTVGFPGRSWDSECVSGQREGRYAKYFRFTLDRESEVTITLESRDADPYLYLREDEAQSGAYIARNDDHEGSTSISQIQEELAAGTYTIEATTYAAGQGGSFSLSITGPAGGERAALLALYEATGGDNWTNSENWGSNELVREWHGVFTDEQGQVIGLSLGGNRLNGQIPADLDWGVFDQLEWLDLSNNNLTGPIPSELGDLPVLQQLYLHQNLLTGSIPAGLGNQHLTRLVLHNNQLTGSIPAQLTTLVSLRVLSLAHNQLEGSIPGNMRFLSTLRLLNLEHNLLSGPIPPVDGLSNLEVLLLGHNRLSGFIPANLGNLSNLRLLRLDNQSPFTGGVTGSFDDIRFWLRGFIPSTLGSLRNLEELDLSNNRLIGSIPPGLGSLESLLVLDLRDNELAGDLPSALTGLDGDIRLRLYGNQFEDCIPEGLRDFTDSDLARLGLLFCDEVPPDPSTPPDEPPLNHSGDEAALLAFYNATLGSSNWQAIEDAGNCSFGDTGIPLKDWCGVSANSDGRVTELVLTGHSKNLQGSISPELGGLEELVVLNLSGNRLGDNDADTSDIPDTLGDLSNLFTLDLSLNADRGKLGRGAHLGMSGAIPSRLSDLTNLRELHLNGNSLRLAPAAFAGESHCLRNVDISDNRFEQAIEDVVFSIAGSREPGCDDFLASSFQGLRLSVNDNGWSSVSEEGGHLARLKGQRVEISERQEIDIGGEILESIKRIAAGIQYAELAYEILTSTDWKGLTRAVGVGLLENVVGIPVETTTLGLVKVYYSAAIGENPLVQQLAASLISGLVNDWSPQEISSHFGASVLTPLGYNCVDIESGARYSSYVAPNQQSCEDIYGAIWDP